MKSWGASSKESVGILRAVYYFGNCHVEKPGWAMKGDAEAIGAALEHLEEEMADVLKKAKNRFFRAEELRAMADAPGNLGARLRKVRAARRSAAAKMRPPSPFKFIKILGFALFSSSLLLSST